MAETRTVEVRAEEFDDRGCEPMLLFWYVNAGDQVEAGQDLCEIETAKAVFVVQAPEAGVVKEILVGEGDAVESAQLLARVEVA